MENQNHNWEVVRIVGCGRYHAQVCSLTRLEASKYRDKLNKVSPYHVYMIRETRDD